jgi:Uma2 family endonuclease
MREPPAIGRLLTVKEFLEFEAQSPIRHEYIGGEVFAMSGATTRHNLIVMNVGVKLRQAARPRGCRTFVEAVMLRVNQDRCYYPDVIVACGRAAEVEHVVDAPSIVVEVTSPSTRGTDRREKLEAYQRVPSLRLYMIVEQRHRRVFVYSRDDDDTWLREEYTGTGDVAIRALGITMSLDEIYDDVPMPPLALGEEPDSEWADSAP